MSVNGAIILMTSAAMFAGRVDAQTAPPTSPATPAPQTSDAPSSARPEVADIIVTAERRSSSVQKIPLAITAVDGQDLRSRQINTVESLSTSVPNLNFSRYSGTAQVSLRGVAFDSITPGSEARTAAYLDGVYISRPTAQLTNLFDVSRIEVLRGPQGTLYGRNATAGAINVITNDPTTALSGYGLLSAGNYGYVQTEGAVSGPLSDTLSARLAFQTTDRNGFGTNISNGKDVDDERSRAVRGKLVFAPSNGMSFKLSADYSRRNDASGGRHDFGAGNPSVTPRGLVLGAALPSDPRDYAGYQPSYFRELFGVSGELTLPLADQLTLTSLSAYRSTKTNLWTGVDGTTAELTRQQIYEKARQFSQEVRIVADFDRLKLIGGGYYFHENDYGLTHVILDGASTLPGPPGRQLGVTGTKYQGVQFGGTLITNAYAAFAQADIDITDKLSLTLGGRYSHEKKDVREYTNTDLASVYNPNVTLTFPLTPNSTSASSFDPKVTLQYKFTPQILAYATFSRGFKSGGFALGSLTPAFKPERLDDYEIGLKATLFDRRLRANFAAFYYDYGNLQVTKVNGTVVTTENAAAATIKGLEAEIRGSVTDAFSLGLNASYLDARFDEYLTAEPARPSLGVQDLKGNRLPQSPPYTITVDATYRARLPKGDLTFRADGTWKDRIYFSPYNRAEVSQPAYAVFNAFVTYNAHAGWSLGAWVRNLANKDYRVSSTVGNVFVGYSIGGQLGDPRTFGVTAGMHF
ncbi:TonB-dependent receptor [Novosphingobium sp.]|uniref:TonB-dependent receptor n=1 Tax=Novosphingobium sp. TaxID=1874826 RepID=UPI002FE10BE0